MTTKIGMFKNGTFVAHAGDGKLRKATDEEVAQYLASQFPEKIKGAKIAQVSYDRERGQALARYSDNKVYRKKVVAQGYQQRQTEPLDSGKKADPDPKVPRDDAKAKPETSIIVKDRPDVGKPKEVRDGDYGRGPKGKDVHTDVVPRDSSGDGVGGKSVEFSDEVGEDATSKNPDKYVQPFTPSSKPSAAGAVDNHTASSGMNIKIRSEAEIYQPLGIKEAEKAKDDKEECDEDEKTKEAPKKKKSEDKDEKSEGKGKMPPWLQKGKGKNDADEDEEKKEKKAETEDELKKASKLITELKEENNRYKLREARQKAATKYVLALLTLRPEKYSDPEVFTSTFDDAVKKMNIEALETAAEEVEHIKQERLASQMKVASDGNKTVESAFKADGGLSTAFVIERKDDSSRSDQIKNILMAETRLGREVANHEKWEQDKYRNNENGGRN